MHSKACVALWASAAVSSAVSAAVGSGAPTDIAVGAIRWDAYWSQPGEPQFEDHNFGIVTRTTTYDMSPSRWHYRVPFFGEEINETAITCDGNRADVMGAELEYVAIVRVLPWLARRHPAPAQPAAQRIQSFCNYPLGCIDMHPPDSECVNIQCCADNVGLSYAWNQYLAHPNRSKVNFTLLLQPGFWFPTGEHGSNETFDEEMQRYVGYFQMPEYQTVLDGRPLVFLFGRPANLTHIQALRDHCRASPVGKDPYVVSMNGQQADGVIDALSSYGYAGGTPDGAPFVDQLLTPSVKQWDTRAQSGQQVIPTVSAGWDPRPRAWDGPTPCPWGNVSDSYTTDPTMEELENFTYIGMQWVADNPSATEAGVVMLSAWNEHDEGHWIEPALDKYGGAEKLEAVKRGIDRGRAYYVGQLRKQKDQQPKLQPQLPFNVKSRAPL